MIYGLCTPCAKKFANISSFNPYNYPISITNPILEMRKLRPRELK